MKLLLKCFLFFAALIFAKSAKSQLSPADSAFFNSVFDSPVYMDDSVYPGNWYQYNAMTSMYEHYLIMDTNFKFKTADLDSIAYLTVSDSLHMDTVRNSSFALYPTFLSETDPVVYLPYTFLNKGSASHAIRYQDTNQTDCKNAFFIIPGNGHHQSYEIAQGTGYHNQWCQIKNLCLNYGDVFTFIKPNQESRAIHWNDHRLGDHLIYYLISANTRYGINYLIEIIAMVKYLKANYDKVFIFGLSEGGYATMLTTMYIEPDAAVISGGYSIDLDTNIIENDFLRSRFDYLVDTFNRVRVKNTVAASHTHYLFTWGENDPIPTMDPEHDFHYTQNYFGPLNNCSYFYDFYDHTFPPCPAIDSFIQRNLSIPFAHFKITDSTLADTLFTQVKFCKPGLYQFDLYKDTALVNSYSLITDTLNISLSDSGKYYIKNIKDSSNISGKCPDTLLCTQQAIALSVYSSAESPFEVQYNNPFSDQLTIRISSDNNDDYIVTICNTWGLWVYQHQGRQQQFSIPAQSWSPGFYYMNIRSAKSARDHRFKLLKL